MTNFRSNNINFILMAVGFLCALSLPVSSYAEGSFICPSLTQEQINLLQKAYNKGYEHNLGYTLAGIVMQESFVGEYIIKVNNTDGKHGSYGITHILLSTAMYLEGYNNIWKAKQDIVTRLVEDDDYALSLALVKLKRYKGSNWITRWNRYNGNSTTYGPKIHKHILTIKACDFIIERVPYPLIKNNRDYR